MANKSFKSSIKTAIKKANLAIAEKQENANDLVNNAVSLIDKAVTKGIYHANKAARIKSKLMIRVN
nr:30S ribosomal protein S20 [Spiroplasma mirum]